MNLRIFKSVKISGIASALPTQSVSIDSFKPIFGEKNVNDFVNMVGVEKYHKASINQTASDLAYVSAEELLTKTKIKREEIDLLIFVTQKPDMRMPSTSFNLHHRLGLGKKCIVFDINLACSGFVYALSTAASFIEKGLATKALVLTGDTSNRTMAPEDRTTIMLFGDNGSATLLESTQESKGVNCLMRTNGSKFKSIITPAGGFRTMNAPKERVAWSDEIHRSDYDTRMKGMEVFSFSISDVPRLINDFLLQLDNQGDDYDLFALHQANEYILKQITRKCKLPKDKVHSVIKKYGNNSSSSIPIVLSDKYGESHDQYERRVLACGFGAGLSWGVMDFEISEDAILPIIFTDYYYKEKLKD